MFSIVLLQEPNSTILLASGMGRHWPDGRGVFRNKQRTLFVWVGEEDHLRIVSMQGSTLLSIIRFFSMIRLF